MKHPFTPEARAAAAAARVANHANTRPTTAPGSETTDLTVGEPVRVNRATPRSGTWGRYDGRNGWVATINTQTLPQTTYTEIGVCWSNVTNWRRASADAWFRADEVVRR